MNHFQSLRKYEDFMYDLPNLFPTIVYSTLVAARLSAKQARVKGEVVFADSYRLVVNECIDIADNFLRIRHYGYEVWHGESKLYWYDSQAHPNTRIWSQRIRITNMCRRTSSTIAFWLLG